MDGRQYALWAAANKAVVKQKAGRRGHAATVVQATGRQAGHVPVSGW